MPRVRRTATLDDLRGVHRPRGIRCDAAARRLPGTDARCAEPPVRRRPSRVAGPLQPRPGRYGRSLQAADVRRREHRDARGRRHHAPAHRFQGHDERAVPEGSRGENTSRTARSHRRWQIRRWPVLRLSRREDVERWNGDDWRARNRSGRGTDRRNGSFASSWPAFHRSRSQRT